VWLERITHIRFAQGEWLLLLLFVPLMVWMARRSIAGLGRFRSRLALIMRILLIAALAAVLARIQLVKVRKDMAVAFVLDKSLSVPGPVQEDLLDKVTAWQMGESRRPGDSVALVTFGANAAIDQPFTEDNIDPLTSYAVVDTDHTDIAAAIRSAAGAMPEAGMKRIVLITDGNETVGSAATEAASARSAGVRIDCFPVRYLYDSEVMVEKVIAPPEVAPGKTVEIKVLVRAHNKSSGTLRLSANGVSIGSQQVELEPGINVYTLERVLDESGVYDFQATIECDNDTMPQNNAGTAFSVVRGPKKVLIVEGTTDDGLYLERALVDEKVAVERIMPSAFPNAVEMLSRYDTVILANVAASDLLEDKIQFLESAVKDYGLGLIMVGGADAFGAGGWRGTPVEEAMPVSMDVKDRQVIPTGALVIINHACECPNGNRWGIQICKAALNTLGKYDEFGLLYYGGMGEQWLLKLQAVTDKAGMKRRIEKMVAGDMPSFVTTLQMAHAALKKSQASVKHVVIISDGDPPAPQPSVLQKIAADGITVSTVAIYPHDPATDVQNMQRIAKICKGRFYYPRKATELPAIFIKEARVVRRGLIVEEPFVPSMVMSTEPLLGFNKGDFPPLKGYVITTPKPIAETPMLTKKSDPLLAHWQYGLGRTVAFTSDAAAKWASDWISWSDYRRFWGQMVEWAERKLETGEFATSVSIQGNSARITVDAIGKDGEYVNFLQFDGSIMDPTGKAEELSLEQTGPGRYEGTFRVDKVGTYTPFLKYTDSDGEIRTHMLPVTVPFSTEYRDLSTNDVLLGEISEIGGGEVIDEDGDVFRRTFAPTASYTDIWMPVLAAAVIVFLADVFVRRVIVDYAKVWAAVRGALWFVPWIGPAGKGEEKRPAYTSRLLTAKKSAVASRKFEADEEAEGADIDGIMTEQAVHRARAASEKRPEAAPLSEVADKAKDDDSYTGRLLKAKRRAREDRGGEKE
jgi:uncharacterized membrane protein/Mg-chelatase subunit ChlD